MIACGYRFSPGGENIDPAIQRVYISDIENKTPEPYLETYFRNAFIDQFRKTSRFRLVESAKDADAVLKGSVNSLTISHLSYTSADFSREDRATAVAEIIFQTKANEIIWRDSNVTWYQDYQLDANNSTLNNQNKRTALQNLSVYMAERTFRAIMSGF